MALLSSLRVRSRVAGLAALTGALMLGPVSSAFAAPTRAVTYLDAAVSGTSVTASATVSSNPTAAVAELKICARNAAGANVDFPTTANATIARTGTWWSKKATFAPGTYSYWVCVRDGSTWSTVGAKKSFTVGGAAAAPVASGGSSGTAMPVGNLSGWRQTFTEDFNTNLAEGSFPGAYAGKWQSYTGFSTNNGGADYNQRIISAHDGVLDLNLHPQNGRAQVAAPIPLVNGKWGGQTYGRFSIRMKADATRGYGIAFMLWSDRNVWTDGEIDWPESGLHDVARGFNHRLDDPSKNSMWAFTDARYSDWHTYTIEWRPDRVTFLLDGKVVGNDTSNVPSRPLHWVLQVQAPEPSYAGRSSSRLLIDWATAYSMA